MLRRHKVRKSDRKIIHQINKKSVVSAKIPLHVCQSENPVPARIYYAALDLGTHNCRLLIVRPVDRQSEQENLGCTVLQTSKPEPENFEVVDSFSRIVRLGEGDFAQW